MEQVATGSERALVEHVVIGSESSTDRSVASGGRSVASDAEIQPGTESVDDAVQIKVTKERWIHSGEQSGIVKGGIRRRAGMEIVPASGSRIATSPATSVFRRVPDPALDQL